jgi:hypothetical protein
MDDDYTPPLSVGELRKKFDDEVYFGDDGPPPSTRTCSPYDFGRTANSAKHKIRAGIPSVRSAPTRLNP